MDINEYSLARGRNWLLERWGIDIRNETTRLYEDWLQTKPEIFPAPPVHERPSEDEVFDDSGGIVDQEAFERFEAWENYDARHRDILLAAREAAQTRFPRPKFPQT